MNTTIQVAIIDDNEMILKGLTLLINAHQGLHVCSTFSSGSEAVKDQKIQYADIVLLDINMPGLDGFETAERLLQISSSLRIILISMETKQSNIDRAIQLGLAGFIPKSAPTECLIEEIKNVYSGIRHFKPTDDEMTSATGVPLDQ